MNKLICPKKGIKMAQAKDCKCDTFNIYLNKNNEFVFECTSCKIRYNEDRFKNKEYMNVINSEELQ